MVGKIVCSRKIATQYQEDQIILAKGGAGSKTICTGLVKVGAERFTRTIGRGGIGDHMPVLVKVGSAKFTRTAL